MSFSPAFTTNQTIGNPSTITVTDTSVGTDAAIIARRVYLKTVNATYLVPSGVSTDYTSWALADSSITVDALDKDYCLVVKVEWISVSGIVLYTATSLVLCTMYNDTFLYHLTQQQAGNPQLIQDANFYPNKGQLITDIDSAKNATTLAVDQYGAQLALDRATTYRLNQEYYF